jgi:type IV pilus assembly protein PilY1
MTLTAAHLKRFKTALAHGSVALLFGLGTGQAMAVDLNISNKPLDTLEGVPANIILTMDDSGSMEWNYMPDSLDDSPAIDNTRRAKSSTVNLLYYNPAITYTPAVDKNGTSLGDASFTAAWVNGFDQSGDVKNLTSDYCALWDDVWTCARDSAGQTEHGVAAFYYVFDTGNTNTGGTSCTLAVDSNDDACYNRVDIVSTTSSYQGLFDATRTNSTGGTCDPATDTGDSLCYTTSGRSDCTNAPDCTYAEEAQNFANWYSYYRARHLLAKTAVTRAFSSLSTSIRVSWQQLNTNINTVAEMPDTLPFDGAHREAFFSWVNTLPFNSGTPLTNAFDRAGQKFSQPSVYRKDPTDSSSESYTCRQNFHFAFTDGYWNTNSVILGNYDNTERDLPDGVHYDVNTSRVADQALPIYRDGNSTFLADIAMKYWATDLNTNLANDVPKFTPDVSTDIDGDGDVDANDIYWNPRNDPATWQHMVNFTVGLGVEGVLPYTNATLQGLIAGTTTWPTTGTGDQHHVDDLWHAAINSRGTPFNAQNPEELLQGFTEVLDAIDDRVGSSSAVATTSSQYQTGTNLFQAIYDPSTWAGDLLAKDVITYNQQWSAANILAQQIDGTINDPRVIITKDPAGDGIPFQWSNLAASQQTALNTLGGVADGQGANRLAYLRGDSSNELQNGGSFRNRTSPLGDLVHSDPFFLPPPGAPLFFWPDDLEGTTYSSFVASHSGRQDMVLFGGNDGMLHIVNASNGREILAYIPSPVVANLSALTNPSYTHQFYVDAPVQVSDVFYGASWHTVAIGGLGKGGQGIYALDVTNAPSMVDENTTAIANMVLWEFTETDDADLGYTYTKPQMFKMNNGKWMVAFGNGYNNTQADGNASTNGDAQLFLLDIEHGGQGAQSVKVKLSTEVGAAEDPAGLNRANRLTDVVAVDQNQDFIVDILYAGDLFGNLWKFDVTSSNASQWTVVKSGSTPTPLFTAVDDDGNPQPITVAPAVQYHNKKNGYLVYVGTGKYLETSDPADTSIQSIYGIWDREESSNITTIDRPSLLEQKILGENRTQFALTNARITTDNRLTWYDGNGLPNNSGANKSYLGWYIDLGDTDTSTGDTIAQGERMLDDLFVSGDRLEFITLIPSTNPCVGGGESWLFAVNAITGSRFTSTTPWDYNLDGNYNTADKVDWGGSGNQVWGSGINLKTPQRFRRTKLLEPGSDCQEINLLNNSDGSITTVSGSCQGFNYGRRSWRQIHIQ